MKITVVKHVAGKTTKLPGAIYIGRSISVRKQYLLSAPHLANPYRMGKDGDRQEVIRKFRIRLWKRLNEGSPELTELLGILDRVNETGSATLVCHCAPLPCHGDVIKAAVEWLDSVTQKPVVMTAIALGAEVLSVS